MNNNTFINDDETLCLLINGNEIKIPKQSKYYLLTLQKLTNALYQTKPKTFCFNFQGNFSKEDFNLYLKYISSNSNINNIIDTLFRFFQLIKVAKELKDHNLISTAFKEDILYIFNSDDKKILIQDEIEVIKWCINEINLTKKESKIPNSNSYYKIYCHSYLQVLDNCIETCCSSIINKLRNILNNNDAKINENSLLIQACVLPKMYIRKIILKAMNEFYNNAIVFDNELIPKKVTHKQKQLLDVLIKVYMKSIELNEYTQIFECLNLENANALKEFDNKIKKGIIKPITWNINNIKLYTDNSFKSEIFPLCDSISFKLHSHYDKQKDVLSLAMEIILIKQINENFFLTILTKIKEDHKEYQSKLHCIYVNCTSKALLLTLYNFSKSKVDNDNETNQTIQKETVDYSIEFYIEMNLLFSGFVFYIITNICKYYKTADDLGKISHNCLKMLLKNKLIHKDNDDIAITAIIRWLSQTKTHITNNEIYPLLEMVNASNISLDCLIELLFKYGKIIKKYKESLGEVIQSEFHERMVYNYNYIDSFNNNNESSLEFTKELINKIILNNNLTINNKSNHTNKIAHTSEPLTNIVTPLSTLISHKSNKEKSISLEHSHNYFNIKRTSYYSIKQNERKRRLSTFNHSTTNNTSYITTTQNNNQNNMSSNNTSLINSRNNCNLLTKNNTNNNNYSNHMVPSLSNTSGISYGHKKNKSVNLDNSSKLQLNPIEGRKVESKLSFHIELNKKKFHDEKMKKRNTHQTIGETYNNELIKNNTKYNIKDNKGRNKFNKLISKTRQPSRIVSPTLSYNKNNRSINNNTMKINNCTVHTISKINMIKKGPIKAKK